MEISCLQSGETYLQSSYEENKYQWAEEHAYRLQDLFQQWQKPLGIDAEGYGKYLSKELLDYCDEPLLKSFIESIT